MYLGRETKEEEWTAESMSRIGKGETQVSRASGNCSLLGSAQPALRYHIFGPHLLLGED